jgi:UDP-2,3-diacylglucosamine pyrophosphatase LpxH
MKEKVNAIFMSDLHLGTKACNSDLILDVLTHYDSQYIILNGDVIDFWQLGFSKSWTAKHNNILRLLFKKARDGTKIILTIGNHDEILRDYEPFNLDNILVINQYAYKSIKYGDILFIHGDAFDFIIKSNKWLAKFGAILYELLIKINHIFNKFRKIFGMEYWSLSKFLKKETKKRFKILRNFDNMIVEYAKRHNYSTICAGHIHIPEMKYIDGIMYMNCGDMCETGSFFIEKSDGEIELITNFKK